MEKVAIVGSRGMHVMDMQIRRYIERLPASAVIVTGCAGGADAHARRWGDHFGMVVVECHANWTRHGKGAGHIRNAVIVAIADRVVAFWDGSSPGTADTIAKARKAGKPVEIVTLPEVVGAR